LYTIVELYNITANLGTVFYEPPGILCEIIMLVMYSCATFAHKRLIIAKGLKRSCGELDVSADKNNDDDE